MKKIIIIGAGIIGLSISYYLRKNGFDVVILEKNKAGMEASYAAAGMLAAQSEFDFYGDFMDFCIKSRDMYGSYCNEIEKASGISVEYQKCGMLRPALDEEQAGHLKNNYEWQKKKGFDMELLGGEESRKLEPNLSKSIISALYSKNDGQVNNRKLMEALIIANKRIGSKIIENAEAEEYLIKNNKIIGVKINKYNNGKANNKTKNNEDFNADIVINAAGSWSSLISENLIPKFNVKPVLGQMASLHSEKPLLNKVIFASILGKGGYIVPRKNNEIVLGSTMEDAGFEKRITAQGISSISKKCCEILPELKNLEIKEKWAGLRPFAEDQLPIIGKTNIKNLILATAHGRNGILLAPITAKAIEELVVNDKIMPEIRGFGVERFNKAY